MSKLVALKPGKALERMIRDVMNGKGEGADNIGQSSADSHSEQEHLAGVSGRVSFEFNFAHWHLKKIADISHQVKYSLHMHV